MQKPNKFEIMLLKVSVRTETTIDMWTAVITDLIILKRPRWEIYISYLKQICCNFHSTMCIHGYHTTIINLLGKVFHMRLAAEALFQYVNRFSIHSYFYSEVTTAMGSSYIYHDYSYNGKTISA